MVQDGRRDTGSLENEEGETVDAMLEGGRGGHGDTEARRRVTERGMGQDDGCTGWYSPSVSRHAFA